MKFLLIVLSVVLYSGFATAQIACDKYDTIVTKLSETYSEARHGSGLAITRPQKLVFEVWASDTTGGWTILYTTAKGWTCIIAVGSNWRSDPPRLPGCPIRGINPMRY